MTGFQPQQIIGSLVDFGQPGPQIPGKTDGLVKTIPITG